MDVGQVDLMMLDILAQRHGKPLHRFLGADKDWAVCYKGGGSLLLTDDELVDDMTRYVSEGYKTVKFKVGSDCGRDMERDIRRIAKVIAAQTPVDQLRVGQGCLATARCTALGTGRGNAHTWLTHPATVPDA